MRPTETPTPGFWVHDLDPVALRFPEGWPIHGIHWYGLAYAAAFLAGAWLMARWRRLGLSPLRDAADDSALMTALMVGVVLGGRLGHVLASLVTEAKHPGRHVDLADLTAKGEGKSGHDSS